MKRLHQVSSPLNDKYFREFGKTFLCPTSFTAKLVLRARAEDLNFAFKLKPLASRNTQGRN